MSRISTTLALTALLPACGGADLAATQDAISRATQVDICHGSEGAGYTLLTVGGGAAAAHLAHHDDTTPSTLYTDADGDGLGDPATGAEACPAPGLVDNGDDCDDTDASIGEPVLSETVIAQEESETCWGLRELGGPLSGQSFTATESGLLTQLDLALQAQCRFDTGGCQTGPLEISLFAGAGFDGPVLLTWQVEPLYEMGRVTPMEEWELPTPVAVTAGEVYTFGVAVVSSDNSGSFCGVKRDVYDGGSTYWAGRYWPEYSFEATFRAHIESGTECGQ